MKNIISIFAIDWIATIFLLLSVIFFESTGVLYILGAYFVIKVFQGFTVLRKLKLI